MLGVDVGTAIRQKLEPNEGRFPVERIRGKATLESVDDDPPDRQLVNAWVAVTDGDWFRFLAEGFPLWKLADGPACLPPLIHSSRRSPGG